MNKTKFAQHYIEHKKTKFKTLHNQPEVFYKSKIRHFFYILKFDMKMWNKSKHPYDIYDANQYKIHHDLDCLINILESTLNYLKYLKYVLKKSSRLS